MKTYVWLTFGLMGWIYYEMSGGADFVPEQRAVAAAEVEDAPEVVTRSDTTTLLSVSASNAPARPLIEEVVVEIAQEDEPTDVTTLEEADTALAEMPVTEPVAEPEVDMAAAQQPEAVTDIREVAGSRVNMRTGPGTSFDVITTLDGGTALEVLSVNENGWANVATVDRRVEGWMAERLLTDPET